MLSRKFTATILTILLSANATACICPKLGEDFFDTVSQHNNKIKTGEYPQSDALTIVTGRVIKYQETPEGVIPPSMQVKVGQIIQGNPTTKTIWIDGDTNGYQCRPPITHFKVDAKYIFAIQQDENKKYYISGCGYYSKRTAPSQNNLVY
jgi:hypothetical protein